MSTYYLNSFDSTPLFVHCWDEVENPKGLVLVCHDVGTHSGRYEGLARVLNEKGMVVLAYDLRGFGATARPERLGFGNKKSYEYSVEDIHFLFRYFKREYDLPIVLMGQGYGGYLILSALERGMASPRGVALLSVGKQQRQNLYAALAVAKTLPLRDRATTLGLAMLQPLVEKEKNEKQSGYADPLDNVVPTVAFDLALIEGLLDASKGENFAKIDKTVPYALFAGMKDAALGAEGESALALLLSMRALGIEPRFFGYEDAAHDLLTHPLADRYCGHIAEFVVNCIADNDKR